MKRITQSSAACEEVSGASGARQISRRGKDWAAAEEAAVPEVLVINVIIVNWNSSTELKRCLSSVLLSQGCSTRVLIVDNGSTPDELRALDELIAGLNDDRIFVLHAEENRGYAGGNNLGYRYLVQSGLTGHVLILNPDTTVSRDTVATLGAALRENVGIVTPRVVDPHGRILYDGIRLNGYRQIHIIGAPDSFIPTDYAQGACMLLNEAMIARIGLFDERFFLYWEEVDLSLRARRAGYRLVTAPSARLSRAPNLPSRLPTALYYSVRNAQLIRRLHPQQFTWIGYCLYVLRATTWAAKLILRPPLLVRAGQAIWCGLRDGLRGHYGRRW